MNSDFSDLLSLFNRHRLRYLVVGGYAVISYTNPRYTKDLDVVVALTDEDTERAAEALKELGFSLTDADLAELRTPNKMIVLGRPPSRIDVLNGIDGIDLTRLTSVSSPWTFGGNLLVPLARRPGRGEESGRPSSGQDGPKRAST